METKEQKALLKEFKVNKHFSITRNDYESMPCPLCTKGWTDKKMRELAKNINSELARWDDNDPEGMEDDFWSTMEDVAVRMGMKYYDELADGEGDIFVLFEESLYDYEIVGRKVTVFKDKKMAQKAYNKAKKEAKNIVSDFENWGIHKDTDTIFEAYPEGSYPENHEVVELTSVIEGKQRYLHG